MSIEKSKKADVSNHIEHDTDAEFHVALGWLATLAISIATVATS